MDTSKVAAELKALASEITGGEPGPTDRAIRERLKELRAAGQHLRAAQESAVAAADGLEADYAALKKRYPAPGQAQAMATALSEARDLSDSVRQAVHAAQSATTALERVSLG